MTDDAIKSRAVIFRVRLCHFGTPQLTPPRVSRVKSGKNQDKLLSKWVGVYQGTKNGRFRQGNFPFEVMLGSLARERCCCSTDPTKVQRVVI